MRRPQISFFLAGFVVLFVLLAATESGVAFDRQPNSDYHARREVLAKKAGGLIVLIAAATEAKPDSPARAYTEILFLPPRNSTQEKWTGPKLGPENPEAPKITGFDRVEDMGQLPNEVARFATGARPSLYTDVGENSPSTQPLAFLKRLNAYLFFQDVKP